MATKSPSGHYLLYIGGKPENMCRSLKEAREAANPVSKKTYRSGLKAMLPLRRAQPGFTTTRFKHGLNKHEVIMLHTKDFAPPRKGYTVLQPTAHQIPAYFHAVAVRGR